MQCVFTSCVLSASLINEYNTIQYNIATHKIFRQKCNAIQQNTISRAAERCIAISRWRDLTEINAMSCNMTTSLSLSTVFAINFAHRRLSSSKNGNRSHSNRNKLQCVLAYAADHTSASTHCTSHHKHRVWNISQIPENRIIARPTVNPHKRHFVIGSQLPKNTRQEMFVAMVIWIGSRARHGALQKQ